MIDIFYVNTTAELPTDIYEYCISKLPAELQSKNRRFIRWQDRMNHLMGQMMLIHGLEHYGIDHTCLANIAYAPNGRPCLPGNIEFNISHSGTITVCAITSECRIGIDIEEIKAMDFNDVLNTMSADQWKEISTSPNPLVTFFDYWAAKESLIKADSRGLSLPLAEIRIDGNCSYIDGNTWYLQPLFFDQRYRSYLAADKTVSTTVQCFGHALAALS